MREKKTIKTPEKKKFSIFVVCMMAYIFYITNNVFGIDFSANKSLTTSSFVIYFASGLYIYDVRIDETK